MAKVPYVSNNAESKICATRVPTGILLGVYFGMSLHPTHYPIGSALTKPMCATFCARSRARKDNSSNTHRCAQYEYVEHFLLRRHARIALSSGEEGLLRPTVAKLWMCGGSCVKHSLLPRTWRALRTRGKPTFADFPHRPTPVTPGVAS